jgi:hypothetical protein
MEGKNSGRVLKEQWKGVARTVEGCCKKGGRVLQEGRKCFARIAEGPKNRGMSKTKNYVFLECHKIKNCALFQMRSLFQQLVDKDGRRYVPRDWRAATFTDWNPVVDC